MDIQLEVPLKTRLKTSFAEVLLISFDPNLKNTYRIIKLLFFVQETCAQVFLVILVC